MKALDAIQRAFAAAVMRPLDDSQGMQREWVDGRPALELASSFIKPSERLDSFERLEIYNRQYWFRLINSIYEDFPGLRAILGEDHFYDLTVAYLAKYPSQSFTLRNLGDRLELFLQEEPQWVKPHETLARDVARLEWAHIVAFDSAELPPLEVDELLESDPALLRVRLQPHLTFLACDYAVDHFVLATRKQEFAAAETSNAVTEKFHAAPANEAPPPPAEENIWLAVHRVNNSVYYKRIAREAYLIGTALQRGELLQAACEKTMGSQKPDETFAANLSSWFSQGSSLGWFCRFEE
jgi:hypothetical protein